jgi:2-oxo-3-hexenedioate decarboxylase
MDAERIAKEPAAAERERRGRASFSAEYPDFDEATAYAAQWAGVTAKVDVGDRIVGAKLGLVRPAEQRAMNVAAPIYGWVTASMLLPYGAPVDLARFIQPRAEPEIAFRLGTEIDTPATVASVLAATESVFAAVGVLDSRYDGMTTRPDVVADNASAGGFLLGPRAVPPTALENLALLGCVLRVGGAVTATAAGGAAMGHPAAAVAWLANRLAASEQRLTAGMLVFSGGLTEPVALIDGVAVTVEFDGLGTIEVYGRESR